MKKTQTAGARRGRPVSPIPRTQFNVNLPEAMVAWLRERASSSRRQLNVEVEELLREAANGELDFVYGAVEKKRKTKIKRIKIRK